MEARKPRPGSGWFPVEGGGWQRGSLCVISSVDASGEGDAMEYHVSLSKLQPPYFLKPDRPTDGDLQRVRTDFNMKHAEEQSQNDAVRHLWMPVAYGSPNREKGEQP